MKKKSEHRREEVTGLALKLKSLVDSEENDF